MKETFHKKILLVKKTPRLKKNPPSKKIHTLENFLSESICSKNFERLVENYIISHKKGPLKREPSFCK